MVAILDILAILVVSKLDNALITERMSTRECHRFVENVVAQGTKHVFVHAQDGCLHGRRGLGRTSQRQDCFLERIRLRIHGEVVGGEVR